MKKDRVYYGMISGVSAGIVQNSLNLLSYALGIATLRYLDWISILTYGHPPVTILDGAFALAMQLVINGLLGIIFVYLLPIIGFKYHLFKGVLIGIAMLQFSYIITTLFKVPGLVEIPTYTVISNAVTSGTYGLVLAIISKRWVYKF